MADSAIVDVVAHLIDLPTLIARWDCKKSFVFQKVQEKKLVPYTRLDGAEHYVKGVWWEDFDFPYVYLDDKSGNETNDTRDLEDNEICFDLEQVKAIEAEMPGLSKTMPETEKELTRLRARIAELETANRKLSKICNKMGEQSLADNAYYGKIFDELEAENKSLKEQLARFDELQAENKVLKEQLATSKQTVSKNKIARLQGVIASERKTYCKIIDALMQLSTVKEPHFASEIGKMIDILYPGKNSVSKSTIGNKLNTVKEIRAEEGIKK